MAQTNAVSASINESVQAVWNPPRSWGRSLRQGGGHLRRMGHTGGRNAGSTRDLRDRDFSLADPKQAK
ncbi:hypothetical protein ASPCADRAFT_203237 [Aspergillus carbonarius ITEM 5010]|uniref:Uncharacterized protein n=1 Tax=Aspergillus carbonarius (strain ITEM 5010) TaxID=602072 RepID=A0A1R3RY98_ASPC5|nr:hypothetical protein ASPCADRAFT_203237 [Aspergillus carbonarius ITEM 5010]